MKLTPIATGYFKLDGGAMFGVVPKQMWQKMHAPDQNNMCTWAMRCLLIETGDRKILVDTGLGDKQDAKFRSHFEPHGTDTLLGSLAAQGLQPDDITDVLLTHLHFDHVGGAVRFDERGQPVPTFGKARYWSNQAHYRWAYAPNPREQASFLHENFVPLAEHGVLHWIDTSERLVPWLDGIDLGIQYGHTEAMMTPHISVNGRTVVYCADLLASEWHVGLPYVMAYDVRPLDTISEKARLLEQAADHDWILFFEHSPYTECATVRRNDKGRIVVHRTGTLAELLG